MMPAVASSAPQFDVISVVRGDIIRLRWKELHAGEWQIPDDEIAPEMTPELKLLKDADALDRWRIYDLDAT